MCVCCVCVCQYHVNSNNDISSQSAAAACPSSLSLPVSPSRRYVPCLTYNRNIHEIQLFQNDPKRLDGPLQGRRVRHIKRVAGFMEQLPTLCGFLHALVRQRTVSPTRELVEAIPSGFAMPDQNDRVLHRQARRGGW